MKQILNNNIDDLEYAEREVNSSTFILNGTQKVIKAVEELKQLNFLTTEINELMSLENIYYSKSEKDEIRVDHPSARKFKEIVSEIYTKSIAVLDAIDQAIPNQKENSISIKLPDYSDLDQLQKFFNKLNNSLDKALKIEQIKGSVTIQNFDSGSLWVELVINGGTKAISFVGSLTYAAVVLSKKVKENKLMQANIDSLNIRNESMKDLQSALKKQIDAITEAETKNLLGEQKIQCDNEDLERMKHSVKTLAELITEGTQIKHALNAPEEVAENFPDFSNINLIESTIKQIEENNSSE